MIRYRTSIIASFLVIQAALFPAVCNAQADAAPASGIWNSPHISSEIVGRRHSPVVVVVHGGPGVSHNYLRPEWDRISAFAKVVYYDQRGCGLSDRIPPYTWRTHVADLDRVARHSADGEPVVLAGSSWGALLSLLYTLEHPERVQALVLTGVPQWPDSADIVAALDRLPDDIRARIAQLDSGRALPEPALDSATLRVRISGLDSILVARLGEPCPNAQLESWASLRTAPSVESLREIRQPVLFITGGHPGTRPDGSTMLTHVLPNARRFIVDKGGHDPWYDAPQLFFDRIHTFLQRDVRNLR
jgi:pimeloyl-ACP methyl ester carboxylesterase